FENYVGPSRSRHDGLRNGYERYIETITKSRERLRLGEEVHDRLRDPVDPSVVEARVHAHPHGGLGDPVGVVERARHAVVEAYVAGLPGEVARQHEPGVDPSLLEVQLEAPALGRIALAQGEEVAEPR